MTSGGAKGKGGRRKHLDADEAALWHHAAQSIEPLKKAKGRVHRAHETDADDAASRPRAKAEPKGPASAAHRGHGPAAHHAPSAPARASAPAKSKVTFTPAAPPPLATFDRKKVRKIRSGRVEIEARIDLHGLRQDEAHSALRAFLNRCAGKGQRWVLVITGKGKAQTREDHETPFELGGFGRDRGILRRNVPRWLDEPDLRPLVISYATAAAVHGGEGALYVHLRTKGR